MRRHPLSNRNGLDTLAHPPHDTRWLVSGDVGEFGDVSKTVLDMQIGPTNAARMSFDQHFAWSNGRDGDILHPKRRANPV
jgi:UDP-N-acetylmuramyl pentapeptide synthase